MADETTGGEFPEQRPIQSFEDGLRPARLMLRVYKLLDSNDNIQTEGDFVRKVRGLVEAAVTEDLLVVQNELFLGIIRERAGVPRSDLKRSALCHLLRQAVVASCSALDVYLPALLRVHLPTVIGYVGREFVPKDDEVRKHFAELAFGLDDILRVMTEPPESSTLFIAGKILGVTEFKYLSSRKGVFVAGALLGIPKPWDAIATHLHRDRKELMSVLDEAVQRRNDIVHRGDRKQGDRPGEFQTIEFAWTQQAVDTIDHVCRALDELVEKRIRELRAAAETIS